MTENEQKWVDFVLSRNQSEENFPNSIGIVFDVLEPRRATAHVVVERRLCNPLGIAHGGMYFTMMDQMAGMMVASSGRVSVTTQSSVNYLRSASIGETVYCEMKAVHIGRSTALVEGRCVDEQGRVQCTGSFQFFMKGNLAEVLE